MLFERTRAVAKGFGEDFMDPNRGILEKAGTVVRAALATAPAVANDILLPPAQALGRGVQDVVRGVTGEAPRPPAATTTVAPAPPATLLPAPRVGGLAPPAAASSLFTTLNGPAASASLESSAPGTAVVQGRFAGGFGPETRSYTKAGVADAGSRLNVVKGLFSGISPESEGALSGARQAAADRGDFDAVDRSYRSDEGQVAHELSQAQGAIGRGVTNSLRNGVSAKLFPDIVQSFAGLQQANAKAVPGLGDYAAIANAQTNAGNLAVNQAKLTQTQAADAATAERRAVNDIAKISVSPETGLFDQARFDQNLVQYGQVYGLGGDTGAAPTAGGVDALTDNAMRARGHSDAKIKQLRAARAGQ